MDLDKIKEAIDSVRSFYEEQCIFMKRFGYGRRWSLSIWPTAEPPPTTPLVRHGSMTPSKASKPCSPPLGRSTYL